MRIIYLIMIFNPLLPHSFMTCLRLVTILLWFSILSLLLPFPSNGYLLSLGIFILYSLFPVFSFIVHSPIQSLTPSSRTYGHYMITRSRTGSQKPHQILNLSASYISPIPCSTFQDLCDPKLISTMDLEMAALQSNHTWDLVSSPSNGNIVGCWWLFRYNFDLKGNLNRYKGCLVSQGFSQQPRLEFDDNYSLVVKPTTIRTILNIDVSRNWSINKTDFKNVFLHGNLIEDSYMRQPMAIYTINILIMFVVFARPYMV